MQAIRLRTRWVGTVLVTMFLLTSGCETTMPPAVTDLSRGFNGDVLTFVQDFAREALAAFLF